MEKLEPSSGFDIELPPTMGFPSIAVRGVLRQPAVFETTRPMPIIYLCMVVVYLIHLPQKIDGHTTGSQRVEF